MLTAMSMWPTTSRKSNHHRIGSSFITNQNVEAPNLRVPLRRPTLLVPTVVLCPTALVLERKPFNPLIKHKLCRTLSWFPVVFLPLQLSVSLGVFSTFHQLSLTFCCRHRVFSYSLAFSLGEINSRKKNVSTLPRNMFDPSNRPLLIDSLRSALAYGGPRFVLFYLGNITSLE